MLVNRAALGSLTAGFNVLFNQAFAGVETQYLRIATEVISTGSEEGYKWLGMIPRLKEWIGDKEIQNLSASDYTIKNKDYEVTIGVDRNDIEDDRIGIYKPVIEDMGQAAKLYPEGLVFGLLKTGFTALCYDKKAFFATDHKIGKKTVSNKGTKKLSILSYQDARTAMMGLVDENGNPLNVIPNVLVVAPANEAMARKILMAETIDGTTNTMKGTAELLVSTELAGADDQWYLLCTSRPIKPLIFQNRKKPKLVSMTNDTDDNVFFNKQFLYSTEARGNSGYGLWQLAYGSTGAEA